MRPLLLFFILSTFQLSAQESAEQFAQRIFNYIQTNDPLLKEQFVELTEYTAFIDRLEKMTEEQKEEVKNYASRSYTEIRKDYAQECTRILKLYRRNQKQGVKITYQNSTFSRSKNFPEIGMISCFYIADIPEEEEPLEDAIRFECIKTANGWKILDGFFDDPRIN